MLFSFYGNKKIRPANIEISYTPEQILEIEKCIYDPIYFAENYIYINTLDKGVQLIELYDYQKKLITAIHENRYVICLLPRQSGKTTAFGAYLLHYCLFNDNKNILIAANKNRTATGIMNRIKLSYENIPTWMQEGVLQWNKQSIELENGCMVQVETTTEDSGRSGSYNFVMLDEFAFVEENIANAFYTSIYPTISSGETSKMVIVSTPNGMNLFHKLYTDAVNKKNQFHPIEIKWNEVPGRGEDFKKNTIEDIGLESWMQEYECVHGLSEIYVKNPFDGSMMKTNIQTIYNAMKPY